MRVRIYPVALGKIINHAASSPEVEVAGLMIGKGVGRVVEVWDAVTGPQRGTRGFVQLDEMFIAQVAERLHSEGLGLYIVGWYHSHPGLSVFMSAIDIRTQLSYQAIYPKAIALVIDPAKYLETNDVSDIAFKVFHVHKEGGVVELPVSIGSQKRRVIESTITALRGCTSGKEGTYEGSEMIERARRVIRNAGIRLIKWKV